MTTSTHTLAEQTLARLEPFRDLDPATRAALAREVRVRHFARDEIVVQRGDRPAGMYLVAEGEIKLHLMSSAGAERIVRLCGADDSFCEENVFGDAPQPLAAQATRETVVLYLPNRALLAAMATTPALARALMARLSERMCELVAGIEQCEQRNNAQRVAHYLVRHASRASDAIEVRLATKKQTIASQLNMSPESFSRVLNRFTREGFIVPRGRRSIALMNYTGLERLAA